MLTNLQICYFLRQLIFSILQNKSVCCYIMKIISSVIRSTRSRWNKIESPKFSEQVKGNVPQVYQDWEYCKMITNQLKNNNIKPAISLLFQSYFNNTILDIQIYSQIYSKIYSESLPISYAQIVYIIYRQHFPPHALMTGWMNKLTLSKNQELVGKLKKDYQIIGEPYPQHPKTTRRQTKKENKEKQAKNIEEPKNSGESKPYKKTYTQSLTSVELPNITSVKSFEGLSPEQLFRSKLSLQVKEILSQLSIDISQFTRVIVHNVEVQFQKSQMNDQEMPSDQEYEFAEDDMQALGLYGLDISKIKIGKIEFVNDKLKN